MPTDPHFSCCQQESNVCQRPDSQRWGHQDLHLHICFAKTQNSGDLQSFQYAQNGMNSLGWRNCLCFSFSEKVAAFSLYKKYLLFYNRQRFATWIFVCSVVIRKKATLLHVTWYERSQGTNRLKKEPNTLNSFRKLLVFNVSPLGLRRCWDQETAWSELLEGWCSWSPPYTEASRFGFEGFKRSIQIFLLPAVSVFFLYLGRHLPIVMCLHLMPG